MSRNYQELARSFEDCDIEAGAARKFNTTITLAFLSLVAERMLRARHNTFDDFIVQNKDLLSGNVLARWYSPERLQSDLARTVFLMPDAAAWRHKADCRATGC